ncbi:MAG: phosphodiester glycosidase family protein, partial [Alphaproteobacteria bacterium]|nr:phosphodiester glycosidase family protein [Alphaproteobacteria bacterium]
ARQFAASDPDCRYATQSGPMLVIDGRLHPRFLPRSDSRFVRNGVGVTENGSLIAAISNRPVNFHRFARFFRDVLKTPNALFLDGKVSRLYAPGLDRHDLGFPMGPMLGVVE